MRSASGFVVDTAIHGGIKNALDLPQYVSPESTGEAILTGLTVLKTIDNRHQQSFRYHDSGYAFEYELVQYLFRQSRELQVMK